MTLKEIDILLQMEALKIRVKELEADKLSYESHHEASDKVLYEFQERVRKAESSLVKLKEAVEKINSWDYWCFDPHSEGIEWFLKAKDLLNGVFDDLTSQASPPKL